MQLVYNPLVTSQSITQGERTMIDLRINSKLVDAVLPVNWCLDAPARKIAAELSDPVIVILICKSWKDSETGETHWNVRDEITRPLSDGRAYIRFNRSGEYRIVARVRGGSDDSTRFDRLIGRYPESVDQAVLEVVVPTNVFAQKNWLQLRAEAFTEKTAVNECHMRKLVTLYLLGAPILQAVVIIFGVLYFLLMLIYLPVAIVILGFWQLDLGAYLKPFGAGIKKPSDQPLNRNLYWRALDWWFSGLGELINRFDTEERRKRREAEREARTLARRKLAEKRLRLMMEDIACDHQPTGRYLPPVRKIRLWFEDTKAEVCRQYEIS